MSNPKRPAKPRKVNLDFRRMRLHIGGLCWAPVRLTFACECKLHRRGARVGKGKAK